MESERRTKKLALLGSTGSIGTQTLNVVRGLASSANPVKIEVLGARSNVRLLEEQIREFRPAAAVLFDRSAAKDLKDRTRDLNLTVLSGMEGLCEAAAWRGADLTLNAVVGMVGLQPTLAAIRAKKPLALANKETLAAGGGLVMKEARQNGVPILPVDSEHSAIFQCLQGCPEKKALKKLILTASGGPFFGKTREELKNISPEQALRHPNWNMGAKVTVDSSTLMNKGLEVIEASWLFDMPPERIDVVVHRESIVHSLIEYQDNSVIAQMGLPDMRIPIQYALTYPDRCPSPVGELELWREKNLTFCQPDLEAFQCLKVCIQALRRGGLVPAAANGANETAVELFLQKKISFLEIGELVAAAADRQPDRPADSLEAILAADRAARDFVETVARH